MVCCFVKVFSFKKYVFVLFLLSLSCWLEAATLLGKVIAVSDGDTLTLLDDKKNQYKIRLAGIDAPEKDQPFGESSKENLSYLVLQKNVAIEWSKKDRYGRIVGKVLIDSIDICLVQVQQGMAWHYKKYESDQPVLEREIYKAAEESARKNNLGLWKELNPTEPSHYRRRAKFESPF